MTIFDLTHPIHTGMPAYPGDPGAALTRMCTHGEHGFCETELKFSSHTGTHVDAPFHMMQDGPTIDWFDINRFGGPAVKVDLTNAGEVIAPEHLDALTGLDGIDYVLLETGWDRHWGTDQYYKYWPELSVTAARMLTGLDLKGIGMDTPSPDPLDSSTYRAHESCFLSGMVIVENLTGLAQLPQSGFTFLCLPLPLVQTDGSPCRAAGLVP